MCSWTVPTSDGGAAWPACAAISAPTSRSVEALERDALDDAGRGAGRRAAPPADARALTSASRYVPTMSTAASRGRAGDVAQEVQRAAVGPVEVVEDERERRPAGDLVEERRDRLEQQVAPQLRVARRGSGAAGSSGITRASSLAPGMRATSRPVERGAAQRLDEGLVGDERLLLAGRVEHRAVAVRRARELLRQARLADPRLAGHEHEPPAAARVTAPTRRAATSSSRSRATKADCSRGASWRGSAAAGGSSAISRGAPSPASSRWCSACTSAAGAVPSSSRSRTRRSS